MLRSAGLVRSIGSVLLAWSSWSLLRAGWRGSSAAVAALAALASAGRCVSPVAWPATAVCSGLAARIVLRSVGLVRTVGAAMVALDALARVGR